MDREGHPEVRAFRALFDSCAPSVLAYALRRVADPADAADVVADTFLVAWRRRGQVPPGEHARPWLFGVARRVLANQRRGARRRTGLADRLRERLAAQVLPDHAEVTATALAVRAALGRLHEDDREVLLLTAAEGLTPTEIAVVLDAPAATVRSRLFRARRRLDHELRGERPAAGGQVPTDGHPLVTEPEGS